MTKKFAERVKKEMGVFTKNYYYSGSYTETEEKRIFKIYQYRMTVAGMPLEYTEKQVYEEEE